MSYPQASYLNHEHGEKMEAASSSFVVISALGYELNTTKAPALLAFWMASLQFHTQVAKSILGKCPNKVVLCMTFNGSNILVYAKILYLVKWRNYINKKLREVPSSQVVTTQGTYIDRKKRSNIVQLHSCKN